MSRPDIAAYMLRNGFDAAPSKAAAEFADFIRQASATTAEVIRRANVHLK